MAFSIMLNFAIGIMIAAIPIFDTDPSTRGGLNYNAEGATEFTGEMEKTVTPGGELTDAGNEIYRVLDMLNIGFIQRIINAVKQYAFGFIKLLDVMLGGYLEPGLYQLLFGWPIGILYNIMLFGYIIGAWALWTGKDLDQ